MCSQGSALCRVGEREGKSRERGLASEAGQTNDSISHTPPPHTPFKGLVPDLAHKQRRVAFCYVGAKEGKDFSKQVHVDLEDLALGREGHRVEGRRKKEEVTGNLAEAVLLDVQRPGRGFVDVCPVK